VPGRDVRAVLTGDTDGPVPGVAAALAVHGWHAQPADLPVADDPLAALADDTVLAVIPGPGATTPPRHGRILTPLLDRGMIALVLPVRAGRPTTVHHVPIDRTLPADAAVLGPFAGTPRTVAPARPTGCATCHPSAEAAWSAGPHAAALASLPEPDRTDTCLPCHVTQHADDAITGGVSCIACHQAAAPHASDPHLPAGPTRDCRACHDAAHDPGFDPIAAWHRIRHGRE
jgi:hypothetical protein